MLSAGDKVLALESGRFATGWGEMAAAMGVATEVLPGDWRLPVDPAALTARLRDDTAGEIKAILAVQVDTASGVVNDIPAIRQAMDAAGHGALLMVDTIASLATMPFEMDEWGVDVAVTGSQKGLMTPPGLSFVAAGEKAIAAHREAGLRTRYWDWTAREGEEHYQKYCGTPPEHMLFGLRQAIDMLFEEGLDNVLRRHALLAEAARRARRRVGRGRRPRLQHHRPGGTRRLADGCARRRRRRPAAILRYTEQKCGVVLSPGIGGLGGKAFRIAHMGHVNAPMLLGTLGAVEIALAALDIAHGRGGVQAAIDWLAKSVPA